MNNTTLTVGFALTTATIFDLETREIGVRLDFLDEWHLEGLGQRSGASSKVDIQHPSSPMKLKQKNVSRAIEDNRAGKQQGLCVCSP